MKKAVVFCVLALVALGVVWYIFTDGAMNFDTAKRNLVREAQDAVITQSTPEEVATLALKAINLTQGEKGIELWRLKADWGNMRRKDNILELEKPKFTYYMPPDSAEVHINALKGEIDQEKETISFVDSVVATLEDKKLDSSLAVYYGKAREMIFPRGAQISGSGLDGRADQVIWRLNDKKIVATGNVDMTFKNEGGIFGPHDADGNTPPVAKHARGSQG